MNKISEQLIKLSDALDQNGKSKCADAIDNLIGTRSLQKVAQYVGVIGYVLKQNRAIGNCIRKKRVASNSSMQEVVLECLSEYQDGQQYGNNDWTAKYAQVIQEYPEGFSSSHVDFLEALAEKNQISEHITNIKEAQKILLKDNMQDAFLDQVIADLDDLEKILKEGDVSHRPFKLAAPPSSRGFWSRLFAPSWSKRGKDKETQAETDRILESLMNIGNQVQQIRAGISRLSYNARLLNDPKLIEEISRLSDRDWDETVARLQNVQFLLQNTQTDTSSISPLIQNILNNMNHIYQIVSYVQSDMYNLRQRDAVTGRGGTSSASDEYGDLDRALNRLYSNPLDQKALYYSQKLHGRLQDALNNRRQKLDPDFQAWADEQIRRRDPVPRVEMPTQAPEATIEQRTPQSTTERIDAIVENIARISDPHTLAAFIRALNQVDKGAYGGSPEAFDALRAVLYGLREKMGESEPQSEAVQTTRSSDFDINTFLNEGTNWLTTPPPSPDSIQGSITKLTMLKMAEDLRDLDEELADIVKKYIEEQVRYEYYLPHFPENASILKEQATLGPKITQKKGGEVALYT